MTLRRSWRWLGSYCPNSSTGENDLPRSNNCDHTYAHKGRGRRKAARNFAIRWERADHTKRPPQLARRLRRPGASWRLRRVEFEEITPAVSGRARKERMLSAGVSLFAFLGATSAQLLAFRVRQNPKALHGGCRRPHERLEKRMRHNT